MTVCLLPLLLLPLPSFLLLPSSLPPYTDMGVQLFLDIVRTVKPTHIIRLLPPFLQSVDHVRTLPPLTAEFLSTTPGLFTWPEQTSPQPPVKIIEPGYIQGEKDQSCPYMVMFQSCHIWSCSGPAHIWSCSGPAHIWYVLSVLQEPNLRQVEQIFLSPSHVSHHLLLPSG